MDWCYSVLRILAGVTPVVRTREYLHVTTVNTFDIVKSQQEVGVLHVEKGSSERLRLQCQARID